jgi:hypothetical protein
MVTEAKDEDDTRLRAHILQVSLLVLLSDDTMKQPQATSDRQCSIQQT